MQRIFVILTIALLALVMHVSEATVGERSVDGSNALDASDAIQADQTLGDLASESQDLGRRNFFGRRSRRRKWRRGCHGSMGWGKYPMNYGCRRGW